MGFFVAKKVLLALLKELSRVGLIYRQSHSLQQQQTGNPTNLETRKNRQGAVATQTNLETSNRQGAARVHNNTDMAARKKGMR